MRIPIELVGLVDPGTLSRGTRYAQEGRTSLLMCEPRDGRPGGTRGHREAHAEGISRGSKGERYFTAIDYEVTANDAVAWMLGECECPVRTNCKHAVSLLILALAAERAAATGAQLADDRPGPYWQQTLEQIFQPVAPSLRVALAIDFTPPAPAPEMPRGPGGRFRWVGPSFGSLKARPVTPGKNALWVQNQISWSRVAGPGAPLEERQASALHDLFTLWQAESHLGMSGQWIDLRDVSSAALWPVLRAVVDSGVELVEFKSWAPIYLTSEQAAADIAISHARDGRESSPAASAAPPAGPDLRIWAQLRHSELEPGGDPVRLGSPLHGLAWRAGDGCVRLAALREPASAQWTRLAQEAGGIRVPAVAKPQFEAEFLPRIPAADWVSPDGSFDPVQPLRRLHLALALPATEPGQPPRALLHWSWGEDRAAQSALKNGHLPSAGGALSGNDSTAPPRPPVDRRARTAERAGELAAVGEALAPLPLALSSSAAGSRAVQSLRLEAGLPDATFPRREADLQGLDVVKLTDDILPRLEQLGVTIDRVGAGRQFVAAPGAISVDGGQPPASERDAAGRDWLDLNVTMVVGEHNVPMSVLLAALASGDQALFLESGEYVRLDTPDLERLRSLLAEARLLTDRRSTGIRVPRVRRSWWEDLLQMEVVTTAQDERLAAMQRAIVDPPPPPAVPKGLAAQLRPYQEAGFTWLAGLRRAGLGGVLADDMGLGKTVQTLAMIQDERENPAGETRPWVVVAPTSVVSNWVAEAARFTPSLRVVAIEATEERRGVPLAEVAAGADLVVTSYTLLRLESEQYASLHPVGMVLDEAQQAKNPLSKTFRSLASIGASTVYAVTGTPLENNLGELWAMFALSAPGLLGSAKQFRDNLQRPIERGGDQGAERANDLLATLRRRIAPFLLRRTKDTVALDLPEKQEQLIQIDLAPAHRRMYERQLQRERQRVLRLVDDLDSNQVEVLSALTRLRQLSIDPLLLDEESTAPRSKLDALLPLLRQAKEEGHRVLVFSQFTRYLRAIAERLDQNGIDHVYLDGATRNRGKVIDAFREGDATAFLISLKAGGVGLNLTMADYVVITDPWWNPAVEAQAVDRTHRIGQTRPVHVYRLVARDTIEEKVLALQESKRALAASVLQAGGEGAATGGGKLTAEDLQTLFG